MLLIKFEQVVRGLVIVTLMSRDRNLFIASCFLLLPIIFSFIHVLLISKGNFDNFVKHPKPLIITDLIFVVFQMSMGKINKLFVEGTCVVLPSSSTLFFHSLF